MSTASVIGEAIGCVIDDDEGAARQALRQLRSDELHEMIRVLLLTAGLARAVMVERVG